MDKAERAAKVLILGRDIQHTEEMGETIRTHIRDDLNELDRLAATRADLERRIQSLLDGGGTDDEASNESS